MSHDEDNPKKVLVRWVTQQDTWSRVDIGRRLDFYDRKL